MRLIRDRCGDGITKSSGPGPLAFENTNPYRLGGRGSPQHGAPLPPERHLQRTACQRQTPTLAPDTPYSTRKPKSGCLRALGAKSAKTLPGKFLECSTSQTPKLTNRRQRPRGGATPKPRSTYDTIRAIRPKSPKNTMSCSAPQAAKKSVFALHTAFSSDFYDMLSTFSELVRPDFEISD